MKRITAQELTDKIRNFFTGGISPEIKQLHSEAVSARNYRALRFLNWLSLGGGMVLTVVCLLIHEMATHLMMHLLFVTVNLFFLALPSRESFHRYATRWLYTFMGGLYLFAILNAIVYASDEYAILICLSLAMLPTMMLDVYWHGALLATAAWGLYLVASFCYSTPRVWLGNLLYSAGALMIGLCVARYNTRVHAEELASQDVILNQRNTDQLTHVANRRTGEEQIRRVLQRGDEICTMFMVDIDNFKGVNDTFGHGYGDQVLIMVATLLRDSFRSTDLVCRLGGDEFMILAVGVADEAWIREKAELVMHNLAETPPPGGKRARIGISMGAVQIPRYGTGFEELYRKADHALYNAKHKGKNCCHIFGTERNGEGE